MNQLLKILEISRRNKHFGLNFGLKISVLLIAFSCTFSKKEINYIEIDCPNLGRKFAIADITSADFNEAVNNFHNERKKREGKEGYTIIILKDGRSMQFKDIPTEEMFKCKITDVQWDKIHHRYQLR